MGRYRFCGDHSGLLCDRVGLHTGLRPALGGMNMDLEYVLGGILSLLLTGCGKLDLRS